MHDRGVRAREQMVNVQKIMQKNIEQIMEQIMEKIIGADAHLSAIQSAMDASSVHCPGYWYARERL